jgi:hypothetical protein
MQRPCRTADGNAPSLCTVNSAHACKANSLTRRRGEFRVRSPLTSGSDDISHSRCQVYAAYRMSVRLYLILIFIFIQSGISSHTNLGLTVKVSSYLCRQDEKVLRQNLCMLTTAMQVDRQVITNLILFINPRPLRTPSIRLSFLDTVALLACSASTPSDIRNHAVDAKGVGCILFELHRAASFL